MAKTILLPTFLLLINVCNAQLSEHFDDGNFTIDPEWTTTPNNFIVNDKLQLQSNNTTASSSFFITTPGSALLATQWEFWTKLDFNPSSANYVDVWLASNSSQPDKPDNSGYFVRIGSSDDDISLYKKTSSFAPEKIIDGMDGILNKSSSEIKIRIIHTEGGKWVLQRDITGKGNSYFLEGIVSDNEIYNSSYFGILIKQSTSSFFQKHYFDDLEISSFVSPDSVHISETKATTSNNLKIHFDQPLDYSSATDISHYHLSNSGNPLTAEIDPLNSNSVILTFGNPFIPNTPYNLIVNNVKDIFGNSVNDQMTGFTFFKPNRYGVVIDEIFADVSPQVGLPSQKFIELKNTSEFSINLKNWQLNDGNNHAILPDIDLAPDSFLIVTTTSGLISYQPYGKVISVSNFPALNISGGYIVLSDNEESVIHALKYDLNSYGNELKKQGGFSLEMINTKNGCGGKENWIASNDLSGGTPGRRNSVDANDAGLQNINLLQAYLTAEDTLILVFDKSIDSLSGATIENYQLTDGITVLFAETISPFFDKVKLGLSKKVAPNTVYSIKSSGISDCLSNNLSNSSVRFGEPSIPDSMDIVINEVLFNPKTGGTDFVELYNRSNKIIDAGKIYLSNRNTAGVLANFVIASPNPFYLFPRDFLLLTQDISSTLNEFPLGNKESFLELASLPSFPDDKGFVIITDQHGKIIDEVDYNENWHFSLIKNPEGISLERISYEGPSDQTNFHSASTTINGTPGYKNSQSFFADTAHGSFQLLPEVFSPDNDGIDDFLTINYEFKSPGYVTNIKIFDAAGRMVRHLEKNSLSAMKGFYRWDGLDEHNRKLPQGIYIIYFESFNKSGSKIVHKKPVVLARKF